LLQRLAELEAAAALVATKRGGNGLCVIARTFDEASQPEYLNHFATQLAKSEKTVALLANPVMAICCLRSIRKPERHECFAEASVSRNSRGKAEVRAILREAN